MTERDRGPVALVAAAGRTVLLGISQVFLQQSVLCGALVLAGLAVGSPRLAALALLGCVVQTGLGAVSGHRQEAAAGLMGYNGALVGAACSLDLRDPAAATAATVLGAAACVPVHEAFRALLASRPLARQGLPVATAPFCTVAGLMHVTVQELSSPGTLSGSHEPLQGSLLGALNGLAEVFLADGWPTGLLILAGLAAASWCTAAWALGGSVLAVLTGLAAHADGDTLSAGLLGYSAVLIAIAVGTVFRAGLPLPARVALVVAGMVLTLLLRILLVHTPVPVYTWPFVLALWAVLLATGQSTRLGRGSA